MTFKEDINQYLAVGINYSFLGIIYISASPIYWLYFVSRKNSDDHIHENYYLTAGILINVFIVILLLHIFDVLKQFSGAEAACISFFIVVALLISYEQYLINNQDKDENKTVKIKSKIEKEIELLKKRIESLEPAKDVQDQKEPNDQTPLLERNDKSLNPNPNPNDSSSDSVPNYERTLFELLDVEDIDDNRLTNDQLHDVVMHYVLISIVISIFIGYLTDGIIESTTKTEYSASYSSFYTFTAIILANWLGGYKVSSKCANWFAKNWKKFQS